MLLNLNNVTLFILKYRDPNKAAVDVLADAVERRNGSVEQMAECLNVNGPLKLPTSVAFGGADGRTVYVGSVGGLPHLSTFRLPEHLE